MTTTPETSASAPAPSAPPEVRAVDLNEAAWSDAASDLALIYAAARKFMAEAGPLPLVAGEPWEESDEAYRKRLEWKGHLGFDHDWLAMRRGDNLDRAGAEIGEDLDLPRAHLVLVEG